ncbi:MAG TPA: DUF1573 domain-containing protein [Anaerolineales bacterium]|nr:DUF1573 domain-containing protein [Anaerolineales bacterium]
MAKTATLSRREIRARTRKQKQTQKTIQLGLIIVGVLLLAVSGYWLWSNNQNTLAGTDYNPEDVVYDQPLQAIHEMDGPKLGAIPFLPKDGPQPKIAISEDFYNFGSVGPQEVVTYEFALFNQGDAPLTISRAYTTCGCTTADFTATVIPPGKVSIMTLTLDAGFHDVAGQTVRRGVIIENNDPNHSQMEIWVQAAVALK